MKKIVTLILALSATLAFAGNGGMQDRKSESTISIECRDDACNSFVFLETHKGRDFSQVLSREITKEEIASKAKVLRKAILDNKYPVVLEITEGAITTYGEMVRLDPLQLMFAPGVVGVVTVVFAAELVYDGFATPVVAISNGAKTRKLAKYFDDQLFKGGNKTFKLKRKNYLRFKEAVSKF